MKSSVRWVVVAVLWLVAATGHAQSVDAVSRWMAGFEVPADERAGLPTLDLSTHRRVFDRQWSRYNDRIGGPMSAWAADAIPGRDRVEEVFYPFAGADFVTVYRLFPEARRWVLIARQPAGPVPNLADRDFARQVMDLLDGMVGEFGRQGFFVTTELDETFGRRGEIIQGITSIFLVMAAREGLRPLTVRPIRVRDDGQEVEVFDAPRTDVAAWRSVRITMERIADGREVVLDYLAVDLANANLSSNDRDRTFVRTMSRRPVLIKAGSHLLQNAGFTEIRDAIASEAPLLVQDETGLEYDLLVQHFETRLYGHYTTPHREFSQRLQGGLARAYAAMTDRVTIPFRFGYTKESGPCIQVGVRR